MTTFCVDLDLQYLLHLLQTKNLIEALINAVTDQSSCKKQISGVWGASPPRRYVGLTITAV